MKRNVACSLVLPAVVSLASVASAADQTIPGAGNAAAVALAKASPMVRSARHLLNSNASKIHDATLRGTTIDAIDNPTTCIQHRAGIGDAEKAAILTKLKAEGLVDLADDATFPGGLKAGIFPPLLDDASSCPHLPQAFFSAPGSVFGGHHSYPGGLVVHEAFNDSSSISFADNYRRIYGNTNRDGLPEVRLGDVDADDHDRDPSFEISQDITLAAPIWHDWAKPIVFQWNADGTEFAELNFGGNGVTDAFGASGNSKTGAHHIIGVAETMKRNLAPDFVITQACAHSNPTSGNEYKVVNWLRAAAIIAGIDPVARGYLRVDGNNRLRLPALRAMGSIDLNAAPGSLTNLLVEYTSHNLSDADFTFTGPVVAESELFLKTIAPQFGFDPTDTAKYNNQFRNVALSYLTAERLVILYNKGGITAVTNEVKKLRRRGIL
jgi:hypothetical protein